MIFDDKIRTDLALEAHELNVKNGDDDGVIITEEEKCGIKLTRMRVLPGRGELLCKKKAGNYINADLGNSLKNGFFDTEEFSRVIGEEISALAGCPFDGPVLAAGLGNREITADSLGPLCIDGLIITGHLQSENPDLVKSMNLGNLCALTPGVLGSTGIESAKIIQSAALQIGAEFIITIDALAARRPSRLMRTVQLCDTGISPGSGVMNSRREISRESTGIPVISLGIPTVIDASELLRDQDESEERSDSLFVTPKDCDRIISRGAEILSVSINKAVHKGISEKEIFGILK